MTAMISARTGSILCVCVLLALAHVDGAKPKRKQWGEAAARAETEASGEATTGAAAEEETEKNTVSQESPTIANSLEPIRETLQQVDGEGSREEEKREKAPRQDATERKTPQTQRRRRQETRGVKTPRNKRNKHINSH